MTSFNPVSSRLRESGFVRRKSTSLRTAHVMPTNLNQSVISQMSKQRRPISLAPVWQKKD
jgi:hypothetical protein